MTEAEQIKTLDRIETAARDVRHDIEFGSAPNIAYLEQVIRDANRVLDALTKE